MTFSPCIMPKFACIVNPAGRDGRALKFWKKNEEILKEKNVEVETIFTEYVGHASEIAYSLREREDIECVIACGGDGTVHEVASGLRGSNKKLGIIPAGTGNDVARAHNIPLKDSQKIVDILINGVDRHVGAFRLQGTPAPSVDNYPKPSNNSKWDGEPDIDGRVVRWVFLESDCGVTSATSRAKLKRGKWIKGALKYTYLGITEILPWKKKMAWVKINDEEGQIVDFSMLAVTTTEMFGGGYKVSPGASPILEHGQLCHAWGLSKIKMLRLMGPLKKGKHVGKWGIEQKPCKRLEIKSVDENDNPSDESHNPPLYVQADGEPCMQTPALLEYYSKQLWIRGSIQVPWD